MYTIILCEVSHTEHVCCRQGWHWLFYKWSPPSLANQNCAMEKGSVLVSWQEKNQGRELEMASKGP